MKSFFNLLKAVAMLAVALVLILIEAVFWVLAGIRLLFTVISGLWHARRALGRGEAVCPRGHVFLLAGQVYECSACGYTYEATGSLLLCPNPECNAPVASFVNCPTCGLSVRNPFRWGKP